MSTEVINTLIAILRPCDSILQEHNVISHSACTYIIAAKTFGGLGTKYVVYIHNILQNIKVNRRTQMCTVKHIIKSDQLCILHFFLVAKNVK